MASASKTPKKSFKEEAADNDNFLMIDIQDILQTSNQHNELREQSDNFKHPFGEVKKEEKNSSEKSHLNKRAPQNENSVPVMTLSHTAQAKFRHKVKLSDLFEGFRKGQLSWDQVVFNKETVDYLQKNLDKLLDE